MMMYDVDSGDVDATTATTTTTTRTTRMTTTALMVRLWWRRWWWLPRGLRWGAWWGWWWCSYDADLIPPMNSRNHCGDRCCCHSIVGHGLDPKGTALSMAASFSPSHGLRYWHDLEWHPSYAAQMWRDVHCSCQVQWNRGNHCCCHVFNSTRRA